MTWLAQGYTTRVSASSRQCAEGATPTTPLPHAPPASAWTKRAGTGPSGARPECPQHRSRARHDKRLAGGVVRLHHAEPSGAGAEGDDVARVEASDRVGAELVEPEVAVG